MSVYSDLQCAADEDERKFLENLLKQEALREKISEDDWEDYDDED